MNINFTVRCDSCGENTNCRIGMSARREQPLRFACQDCGSPIDIAIGPKTGGINGATKVAGVEPFDDKTNFVDLHLDFPVSFEKYVMGRTPFMRAVGRVGFEAMQLHSARLRELDTEHAKFHDFGVL